MKVLCYFGHPAQYLFLRDAIKKLSAEYKCSFTILIKTKDILEQLLIKDNIPYRNILPKERGKSKLSIILSLIKRHIKILPILIRNRPDLMISTDASIAQLGKLLGINRITITEDDYEVIKTLGDLTYPYTQTILCPEVCKIGKFENKKVGYKGYMKLAYLHPNVFTADSGIREKYNFPEKYVLIRMAKLTAHHDFGIKGLDYDLLDRIISIIKKANYQIYISSEGYIDPKYTEYLLNIDPSDMHHILAFSSLLISDSQSMSVEAAMLGIPSLRYSDFSGRISVLEELEFTYQLTTGIKTANAEKLLDKLDEILSIPDIQKEYQHRRSKLLKDKIDVSAFLIWFISNYPKSMHIMKENPEYQNKFL